MLCTLSCQFTDIRIIKNARQRSGLTVEALAEKTGISERYIYRIENEEKKPKFDVLLSLIRALAINSDLIFYPDKPCKDTEIEDLIRMLYNCDERSMEIIKATVKAALEGKIREKKTEPIATSFNLVGYRLCV